MRQNAFSWISLFAVLCLAASCGNKAASTATDESLTTAIQSKLYADNATRAANIKVDVKGGAVTLSGDVPSSDVELAAMKAANGTAGVQSVNDSMKVNMAAAPVPPPAAPAPAPPTPAKTASAAPVPAPSAVENTPAAPPVRRPTSYTLPAGTRLSVRMIDGIDSKQNTTGQTFRASLDAPLVHNQRVVVPAGAPVTVLLSDSSRAGKVKGNNELQIRVTSLTANGREYQVESDVYDQTGKAKGKQTAIRSGIGAAAGALIGGLAGGGKGAAIGAGAGGGAGLGYQLFTHGSQVKIPSESVVTFRLATPLTISR